MPTAGAENGNLSHRASNSTITITARQCSSTGERVSNTPEAAISEISCSRAFR